MCSLRLKTIASFVEKKDKVADIGCDHAFLSIYLIKNKLCKCVIATDIHQNALENAKKNIQKEHLTKKIPTVLSDGLKNIVDEDIDTLVISGMGTSTILHILEDVDSKKIKKLILQSNNDLYLLRTSLEKKGYYLCKEKVIYEKGHYYVVEIFTQNCSILTKREKYFGLYDVSNKEYYNYLNKKLHFVYKKIHFRHIKAKFGVLFKILLLKKYL